MEKTDEGVLERQRGALTLAALLPAALGLLGPLASAGRLCWLGPALCLPVGLALRPIWRELGRDGLPAGLERAFGRAFGAAAQTGYLLWGLLLLAGSARACLRRLEGLLPQGRAEGFFLLSTLAVSLWLGRGESPAPLARAGRLLFLAVAAAGAFALALAAPGVDWQNLWPPERADGPGVVYSALLCLSLAGYGVYALCLPCREELGGRRWTLLGCGGLAWLLLTAVGTLGTRLTAALNEPFLLVLQGVEVPGAFRRGDAALAAVLTLADFALLALLGRGCRSLWERRTGRRLAWAGYALTAGAFLTVLAARSPALWEWLGRWLPAGNLIFGAVLPALAALGCRTREREGRPTFSALETEEKEDVGGKIKQEKSQKENEKKC